MFAIDKEGTDIAEWNSMGASAFVLKHRTHTCPPMAAVWCCPTDGCATRDRARVADGQQWRDARAELTRPWKAGFMGFSAGAHLVWAPECRLGAAHLAIQKSTPPTTCCGKPTSPSRFTCGRASRSRLSAPASSERPPRTSATEKPPETPGFPTVSMRGKVLTQGPSTLLRTN